MLTRDDATRLMSMAKRFSIGDTIILGPGRSEARALEAEDPKEKFILDLRVSKYKLSKFTTQNRVRVAIPLIRLDVDGSPHTNPDGELIEGTHLHLYQVGFDDKWAYPLDPNVFTDQKDKVKMLEEFCKYCNISDLPAIQVAML